MKEAILVNHQIQTHINNVLKRARQKLARYGMHNIAYCMQTKLPNRDKIPEFGQDIDKD